MKDCKSKPPVEEHQYHCDYWNVDSNSEYEHAIIIKEEITCDGSNNSAEDLSQNTNKDKE